MGIPDYGYAATAGVKWCVLTDGDEYRLLNASAEVDVEEKLFRTIGISISDQDHERTLQTLALLSKEKMGERLPASGQENLLNVLWKLTLLTERSKERWRLSLETKIRDSSGCFARIQAALNRTKYEPL